DAGLQRRRLAVVAPQAYHLDACVDGGELLQDRERAVGATVVDEEDFIVAQRHTEQWFEGVAQLLMQRPYVVALVLDRHYHGQLGHRIEPPRHRAPESDQTSRRRRRATPAPETSQQRPACPGQRRRPPRSQAD